MKGVLDSVAGYLFNNGVNYRAYQALGCHKTEEGYRFGVWAPKARLVSLVGDFNQWQPGVHPMQPLDETGIWHLTLEEGIEEGTLYKYAVTTEQGEVFFRADPFGFASELRPGTASRVYTLCGYEWQDAEFIAQRSQKDMTREPVSIYEMHLGSWRKCKEIKCYRDMADQLVPYLLDMGYTHVEVMPIAEHPLDDSWGYQITGFYAVTSRYGTPQDFMYFVDLCHQNGIGVILDWQAAHFPRDEAGLRRFDGTALYEHPDPRRGEQPQWGTCLFNYGKAEVRSFLISNALFWMDYYHVDGLRVDAVSSMLYLDYGKNQGEWLPNRHGGHENLEAVEFLRQLNTVVGREYPGVMMIAEESTTWPKVTKPVEADGLGFTFKWNMGFMNDMLEYMSMDSYFRKWNHDKLTFSMMYAFSERYILPFSHDEVVHGKKSLLNKMPGEYDDMFDQLRLLFAYQFAHPGKKLNFMGSEFGQFVEWRFDQELDWGLLNYESHQKLQDFVSELNFFYREHSPLYEIDDSWDGFDWLNHEDRDHSVVAFSRFDKEGRELVCIFNFLPTEWEHYRLGVNKGTYVEVLNSDAVEFGGSGWTNQKLIVAQNEPWNYKDYSVTLRLPGYGAVFLTPYGKNSGRKG